MIAATVSLDSEASLYRSALQSERKRFPAPVLVDKVDTSPKVVCWRCGMRGHTADECNKPLPSINALERAIQGDVDYVVRALTATGRYERDKFGCFVSEEATKPVDEATNWRTTTFCLNCGEAGHTFSKCPHVGCPQLMRELDAAASYGGDDCVLRRLKEMWC